VTKKHWIYIKRGLSQDPKHRERIGQAIWCFMHIIDRADWETGIVYDWKDKDEADDMGVNVRTLREWRRSLDENNYITCLQEQYGQKITIHNWINPRDYSSEVLNQLPQGDNITEPQDDAQDTPQGYTQGNRKDVTPTYKSKNQKSKVKEPKITNYSLLLKVQEDFKQGMKMLQAPWEKNIKGWQNFPKWLLEQEEAGRPVSQFCEWFMSDSFRAKTVAMWSPDGRKTDGNYSFKAIYLQAFEAQDNDKPDRASQLTRLDR